MSLISIGALDILSLNKNLRDTEHKNVTLSRVFTCFSGTTGQMPGCVLGRDQSVCAIP
jgi:hypothetical protein